MSIDVDGLKDRADIVAVVGSYVALKKRGVEFVGRCVAHADNNPSMFVCPQPNKRFVHCHSCGFHEDVIGFIQHVEGVDFKKACEILGAKDDWQPAPISHESKPPPDRVTSKPPPDAGEPEMGLRHLGEPSRTWRYLDADGGILGFVARYDTPEGKQIRCWTWGTRGKEEPTWACGHWSKPRPLYGLDRLAARTGAPVLIVEGEKAADAAQELLGQYAVVTWPGGAEAWKHADLGPLQGRTVLLWPDNDLAGLQCMGKVANVLSDPRGLACRVRTIDPTGMQDGFDAADWPGTSAELIAWAKPRARDYIHLVEKANSVKNDEPLPIEVYSDERQISARGNGNDVLREVVYRRMSDVQSKAINWLWPGRFAKGKVSMIVGNPGLGKSQVCASLVSVVTTGSQWPVDRTTCNAGSVVILSAEDDPEDTIRPRLEAAGADLDRVFILEAIKVERQEGDGKRGFDLTVDIPRLGAMLHEVGDVAMVIIDPITAYLGDADSHKNAEVRALLAPLSEMAAAQGVAIISVSHLTKSSGMEALLRVQGSIGFAAAARAVWGVAKDKDNPQRRLFMPLKNNLGTDSSGFAYSVEGVRLPDSDIDTSHVMWENQAVTMTADEVFGQSDQPHEEREALLEAKMYLRSLLADGPVPVKSVQADSVGAGHSWATLRRAQKELKITAYREHGIGEKGKWYWRLDG